MYYDYKVSAEEGGEDVTVLVHYRAGDPTADAVALEGSVEMDGQPLQPDSTAYTGTFYEGMRPLQSFAGAHTITTKAMGKEEKHDFRFTPFSLRSELPDVLKKTPFVIQLKDFPAMPTGIRLVMTDTSYATPDVNEEMSVRDGKIDVDSVLLSGLTTGPVVIEIYREEEQPVRKNGVRVGRLLITYGLKREIELIR